MRELDVLDIAIGLAMLGFSVTCLWMAWDMSKKEKQSESGKLGINKHSSRGNHG